MGFAVKIGKQCLETVSASVRLRPPNLLPERGLRPWTPFNGRPPMGPIGGLPFPDLLGYSPQMKIPGAATSDCVRPQRITVCASEAVNCLIPARPCVSVFVRTKTEKLLIRN